MLFIPTRPSMDEMLTIDPPPAAFIGSTTGHADYAASKAGLCNFTVSLAREVASQGIYVNAVAPGLIETAMLKESEARDKIIDLAMGESALKRVGQPEDLANLVAFLASDKARHITGEVIKIDGGQYI